jgi:hypothetical protein
MKTVTKPGTCGSARGQNFSPVLEFPFEVNLYTSTDELVAAKDELTLAQQLKVRNAERITRARQAAQNALLDSMGIEKQDINNNDQIRLRELFKVLMSSGIYSEDEARELAATSLRLKWAEDED